MKGKIRWRSVLKYAGAYIAFEIGSGFATGQEILQFYTSYGMMSTGAAVISMILFAWAGGSIMQIGHIAGAAAAESPYRYLCGRAAGTFYEYFVLFYLFAVLAVMISGAGAAAEACCGISGRAGGLMMTLLVFGVFVFGLEKLIDIVGMMGPLIIGFSVFIALCTITANFGDLITGSVDLSSLEGIRPVSHWWFSGILYTAYNIVGSVAFLMALGRDAASAEEAAAGGILGGVLLMITVILVNCALMSKPEATEGTLVPSLKLAEQISPAAELLFTIVMLCGIFSTAAPVLWSICSALSAPGTRTSRVIALLVSLDAFLLGQIPFDRLVAAIYPFTGYLGIMLLLFVLRFRIRWRKRNWPQKK